MLHISADIVENDTVVRLQVASLNDEYSSELLIMVKIAPLS